MRAGRVRQTLFDFAILTPARAMRSSPTRNIFFCPIHRPSTSKTLIDRRIDPIRLCQCSLAPSLVRHFFHRSDRCRAMCPIWYAPVMTAKTDNLLARQEFILHQLQESGTISIEKLCSTLGASIATIRRDLEDLEGRSLLKRVRGGAVPIGPLFYERFRTRLPSLQKRNGGSRERLPL
jgi:hypothetical protein